MQRAFKHNRNLYVLIEHKLKITATLKREIVVHLVILHFLLIRKQKNQKKNFKSVCGHLKIEDEENFQF